MPKIDSLDDLISKKAVEYADQIKAAAAMADKEEEIRIESEKQLAFIQKEAGVKLEGKHEFTVASGRIDSVYSRVIIEYKNPKGAGKIGPKADSPGSKKVVEQIKKRFYDMRAEHGHEMKSLFGVGLDGNHFIFVRFRDEKWQVQEPVEVNKVSAERFLWALFNLGSKGKAFSPEYLAGDFGSEGGNTIAIAGIHALYNAIVNTDNPKAQTFFSQWKILFGEVCGYDVDNPSDKIKKLAEFYQVGVKDPKPAELLFAVHTYYALFMKLLAAEIVAFFHKLPTPLQKMMAATTSNKLKSEMVELEAGSIFRHLNITNFLEGDLFAWYVGVWTPPIEKLVREMVTRLDDYNPGTLSEDPTGSRDLLKKLYQQLFPKSVRHDLGEYYTPDWLAEHVLNELGYVGDPDKRLLDPACGSGTFLVMAINRIRKWYDENRERCRYDEGDLCRKILANVIGFDLNPLAVMAARTNYLIAIRDLIGQMDKVEIPVYLCDSVMTPNEYGGLTAGSLGKAKELKTAPTTFIIPTEITLNRDDVAKYAEQLEFCVRNGYSPEEFLQRCRDEGLPVSEHLLHIGLYRELVKLDKANKNGVWARIIKNAFAPIFTQRVDYVVGNPPWINWESLPKDYRSGTEPLWVQYGLFGHKGLKAKLGGAKDDLSILMTYVAADQYLSERGKLGFIITQAIFKSKGGGQGFRRFRIGTGDFLGIESVDDMVDLQPFEGATNRTAVFVVERGVKTAYPVTYRVWTKRAGKSFDEMSQLDDVREATLRTTLSAKPVDPNDDTSPWMTLKGSGGDLLSPAMGASAYRARKGITPPVNGAFWVRILKKTGDLVLVENMAEVSRKDVELISESIEHDFLYPMIRGRDLKRWSAVPSCHILLPHNPAAPTAGISEAALKKTYPKTWSYFRNFSTLLRKSAVYKKFFEPSGSPFYSCYNVGPYTFAPFHVCFKEIATHFECAVVEPTRDSTLGKKNVLVDHKLILVPFAAREEAHFVCALLNSSIAGLIVRSYSVSTQLSTHILETIAVPRYEESNSLHQRLRDLSVEAHALIASNNVERIASHDEQIDKAAAKLWGIESEALLSIQSQLQKMDAPRTR